MPDMPFDVAGPGLIIAAGVGLGLAVAGFVAVVLVEAGVLAAMRWNRFRRSLVASLMMNVATTLVGLFLAGLLFSFGSIRWLLVTFVLSVLIEAGVLALLDRPRTRQGLMAALVANVVTYIPLALLVWYLASTA
jgi:hypothetical protein